MVDQELQLTISPSPHLRSPATVSHAMRDVLLALAPVTAVSLYWFKFSAVFLIIVCLGAAVLTELLFRKILKRPATLRDGSALVTGLLVALCFGAGTAWWTAILATFIGIGLAKELMGGLGWNRFNPALFGRLAVIMLVPIFNYVTVTFAPLRPFFGALDVVTQATPLAMLKQGALQTDLGSLLLAHPGGALGETSAIAVLLGGAYLIYKKHISWHIPASILGTVFVYGLIAEGNFSLALVHILAGGVLLGAFFMATDWVTSPITPKGKLIFGTAIGVLLMSFRVLLGPTEGMAFSILIMNACVPIIDRITKRPRFGEVAVQEAAVPAAVKPAVGKSN
ncbi:MAG: RnfABCDGE type electron transport complex subunit D [Bacillota bacterium]